MLDNIYTYKGQRQESKEGADPRRGRISRGDRNEQENERKEGTKEGGRWVGGSEEESDEGVAWVGEEGERAEKIGGEDKERRRAEERTRDNETCGREKYGAGEKHV